VVTVINKESLILYLRVFKSLIEQLWLKHVWNVYELSVKLWLVHESDQNFDAFAV